MGDAQIFVDYVRDGEYFKAVQLNASTHQKYKKIREEANNNKPFANDDLLPLIIFELCQTDISIKDLDAFTLFNHYLTFLSNKHHISYDLPFASTNLVSAIFIIIEIQKEKDYDQVIAESQVKNANDIEALLSNDSPFSQLISRITESQAKLHSQHLDGSTLLKKIMGLNPRIFSGLTKGAIALREQKDYSDFVCPLIKYRQQKELLVKIINEYEAFLKRRLISAGIRIDIESGELEDKRQGPISHPEIANLFIQYQEIHALNINKIAILNEQEIRRIQQTIYFCKKIKRPEKKETVFLDEIGNALTHLERVREYIFNSSGIDDENEEAIGEFLPLFNHYLSNPELIRESVLFLGRIQLGSRALSLEEIEAYQLFNTDGSLNRENVEKYGISITAGTDPDLIKDSCKKDGIPFWKESIVESMSCKETLIINSVLAYIVNNLLNKSEIELRSLQGRPEKEVKSKLNQLRTETYDTVVRPALRLLKLNKNFRFVMPQAQQLTVGAHKLLKRGHFKFSKANVYVEMELKSAVRNEYGTTQRQHQSLLNLLKGNPEKISQIFAIGNTFPSHIQDIRNEERAIYSELMANSDFINYFIPNIDGYVQLPNTPEFSHIKIQSKPIEKHGRIITYELSINEREPIKLHHLPLEEGKNLELSEEEHYFVKSMATTATEKATYVHDHGTGSRSVPLATLIACQQLNKTQALSDEQAGPEVMDFLTEVQLEPSSNLPRNDSLGPRSAREFLDSENAEIIENVLSRTLSTSPELSKDPLDSYLIYGAILKQELDKHLQAFKKPKFEYSLISEDEKNLFVLLEAYQDLFNYLQRGELYKWLALVRGNPLLAPVQHLFRSENIFSDSIMYAYTTGTPSPTLLFTVAARNVEFSTLNEALHKQLEKTALATTHQSKTLPLAQVADRQRKNFQQFNHYKKGLEDAYLLNFEHLSERSKFDVAFQVSSSLKTALNQNDTSLDYWQGLGQRLLNLKNKIHLLPEYGAKYGEITEFEKLIFSYTSKVKDFLDKNQAKNHSENQTNAFKTILQALEISTDALNFEKISEDNSTQRTASSKEPTAHQGLNFRIQWLKNKLSILANSNLLNEDDHKDLEQQFNDLQEQYSGQNRRSTSGNEDIAEGKSAKSKEIEALEEIGIIFKVISAKSFIRTDACAIIASSCPDFGSLSTYLDDLVKALPSKKTTRSFIEYIKEFKQQRTKQTTAEDYQKIISKLIEVTNSLTFTQQNTFLSGVQSKLEKSKEIFTAKFEQAEKRVKQEQEGTRKSDLTREHVGLIDKVRDTTLSREAIEQLPPVLILENFSIKTILNELSRLDLDLERYKDVFINTGVKHFTALPEQQQQDFIAYFYKEINFTVRARYEEQLIQSLANNFGKLSEETKKSLQKNVVRWHSLLNPENELIARSLMLLLLKLTSIRDVLDGMDKSVADEGQKLECNSLFIDSAIEHFTALSEQQQSDFISYFYNNNVKTPYKERLVQLLVNNFDTLGGEVKKALRGKLDYWNLSGNPREDQSLMPLILKIIPINEVFERINKSETAREKLEYKKLIIVTALNYFRALPMQHQIAFITYYCKDIEQEIRAAYDRQFLSLIETFIKSDINNLNCLVGEARETLRNYCSKEINDLLQKLPSTALEEAFNFSSVIKRTEDKQNSVNTLLLEEKLKNFNTNTIPPLNLDAVHKQLTTLIEALKYQSILEKLTGNNTNDKQLKSIQETLNSYKQQIENNKAYQAKLFLDNAEAYLTSPKRHWNVGYQRTTYTDQIGGEETKIPRNVAKQLYEIREAKKDGNYETHKKNFMRIGMEKKHFFFSCSASKDYFTQYQIKNQDKRSSTEEQATAKLEEIFKCRPS